MLYFFRISHQVSLINKVRCYSVLYQASLINENGCLEDRFYYNPKLCPTQPSSASSPTYTRASPGLRTSGHPSFLRCALPSQSAHLRLGQSRRAESQFLKSCPARLGSVSPPSYARAKSNRKTLNHHSLHRLTNTHPDLILKAKRKQQ